MNGKQAVAQVIKVRAQARRERENQQRQLLPENDDFKATIQAKLTGLWDSSQFWNFCRCGNETITRTCKGCGDVKDFRYRCSLKWCPRCQWWITERRKRILGLWAAKISQPKHLILTQRNFSVLTRKELKTHTQNLARMRRSKSMKNVKGGCVTVEITNEGKGWHVHSHWLIDVRWLDMGTISRTWGKLVGQAFAIVKIKDVRAKDYLQEVSKYVCEGSAMAKWPPEHILEFVTAVRGRRFFFPFGSLFHMGAAIRAELHTLENHARGCECGCSDFRFQDETDVILAEAAKLCETEAKRKSKKRVVLKCEVV
jgi:hypothetical protein